MAFTYPVDEKSADHTQNRKPGTEDSVELDGFSTRLLLELTCSGWTSLLDLLDWLSARQAVPVYVLQRVSGEAFDATLHIENLKARQLNDWLCAARQRGKVSAARVEQLLVRSQT